MALSDLVNREPTNAIKGPSCTVCILLGSLDDTEATALRALMANPRWRYIELAEVLAGEGHDVAATALGRHARGQCLAREKLR